MQFVLIKIKFHLVSFEGLIDQSKLHLVSFHLVSQTIYKLFRFTMFHKSIKLYKFFGKIEGNNEAQKNETFERKRY